MPDQPTKVSPLTFADRASTSAITLGMGHFSQKTKQRVVLRAVAFCEEVSNVRQR